MSVVDETFLDYENFNENFSDIDKMNFINLEQQLKHLDELFSKTLQNKYTPGSFENSNNKQNNDDDLPNYVEANKILRQKIDLKAIEIQKQHGRYEILKKDQKMLSQTIKEKYEAFLMAKKYYKKFLNIYFTIESKNDERQTIFFQYFTDAKKDSEIYSVRLQKNLKNRTYELLSTTPTLDFCKEIQKKLHKCNDIAGALCCIKQSFEKIKMS